MAAKEMYDYLTNVSADYTSANLDVTPQKVLVEEGSKRVKINIGDDGSEERIALSSSTVFFVTLQWDVLSEADAGTIVDFYNDSAKANGNARSFQWDHPTDGHTYVVRFDGPLSRSISVPTIHGIKQVKLKVLGY